MRVECAEPMPSPAECGLSKRTDVNDNLFVWTIKREAVKILRPRLA